MSIFKQGIVCALALGLVASCTSEVDHGPKPEADPDVGLLDGKDDGLSNHYTTIVGSIVPTNKVHNDIDWPDWFHGYTTELEAGATMEIEVDASAAGIFRVYGPARRVRADGRPVFGRALASAYTTLYAGRHGAKFDLEIEDSGLYLVVYGPTYEWSADYTVGVRCAAGCRRAGECFGDDECAHNEYCGDNGVRCITYPCDANYNVCKPKEPNGAWCERDAMCAIGTCNVDECGEPTTGSCTSDDDCTDSWCGWADDTTRVCKPYRAEGESCGGFVLPAARSKCEPGLQCVCTEPTCDAPGICSQPE